MGWAFLNEVLLLPWNWWGCHCLSQYRKPNSVYDILGRGEGQYYILPWVLLSLLLVGWLLNLGILGYHIALGPAYACTCACMCPCQCCLVAHLPLKVRRFDSSRSPWTSQSPYPSRRHASFIALLMYCDALRYSYCSLALPMLCSTIYTPEIVVEVSERVLFLAHLLRRLLAGE